MELFVKICLKIKKDIFESLLKLFVKKDVAYHFPRRTIHFGSTIYFAGVICYLPGSSERETLWRGFVG